MATNTHIALGKVTVSGSSTTSVTFTSISQGYTDLRVVINGGSDFAAAFPYCYINSDTGSNYSGTALIGSGSSAFSERNSNYNKYGNFSVAFTTSMSGTYFVDFQNYSNTTTNKTTLWRMNCTDNTSGYAGSGAATTLWRSTSAITSLDFRLTNSGTDRVWKAGTTFSLYGIAAVTASPKATGGSTYYDIASNYWYHVFTSTGTFTPSAALSCDYLVVAGGGGGGGTNGGGGGAGGLRSNTTQSFSSGIAYTMTVGGGGAGSTSVGSPGTLSSIAGTGFTTFAATGGGAGRAETTSGTVNGGSGGGGQGTNSTGQTAGTGNAGGYSPVEGYAGGNGSGGDASGGRAAGGGGGAGAVGTAATASKGGDGGAGSSAFSSWGAVTSTGQNVSSTYYFAGGGGGGTQGKTVGSGGNGGGGTGTSNGSTGGSGTTNTGGGAGGGGNVGGGAAGSGGTGGSGIVIIRYQG